MKNLFSVLVLGLIASSFSVSASSVTLTPGEAVEIVGCLASEYAALKTSIGKNNEVLTTVICQPKICELRAIGSWRYNTIVRTSPDYKELVTKIKFKTVNSNFEKLKNQGECGELVMPVYQNRGIPAL